MILLEMTFQTGSKGVGMGYLSHSLSTRLIPPYNTFKIRRYCLVSSKTSKLTRTTQCAIIQVFGRCGEIYTLGWLMLRFFISNNGF